MCTSPATTNQPVALYFIDQAKAHSSQLGDSITIKSLAGWLKRSNQCNHPRFSYLLKAACTGECLLTNEVCSPFEVELAIIFEIDTS